MANADVDADAVARLRTGPVAWFRRLLCGSTAANLRCAPDTGVEPATAAAEHQGLEAALRFPFVPH